MDAFTRECVALEADTSFASRRVTRVLEQAMRQRGWPQRIRCDNGPELTSRHFLAWCLEHGKRIAELEKSLDELRGALILAGKQIRKFRHKSRERQDLRCCQPAALSSFAKRADKE